MKKKQTWHLQSSHITVNGKVRTIYQHIKDVAHSKPQGRSNGYEVLIILLFKSQKHLDPFFFHHFRMRHKSEQSGFRLVETVNQLYSCPLSHSGIFESVCKSQAKNLLPSHSWHIMSLQKANIIQRQDYLLIKDIRD